MISDEEQKELQRIAIQIRKKCLEIQQIAGSGHLGGAFSAMEIMVYLYFKQMKIDCPHYLKEGRDIFIISKGHASIGYYSVLAWRGFFPVEELKTYRKIGSRLQGHTHMDDAPGIECSTGSLGQGLSFALGLALGYQKQQWDGMIYVMLGDGEMQEGQVWEALLLQSHLQLKNLVIVIDNNKLQLDNFVDQVTDFDNLAEKLQTFGYNVQEIDGHNFHQIDSAFMGLRAEMGNIIIANTVKGKGISFMENSIAWHSQKCTAVEFQAAMLELAGQEDAIR